jgi:hypothetical protein
MFIKILLFFAFIVFLTSLAYSTKKSAISHKFKILKVRGILKSADQWLRASIEEKNDLNKSKEMALRRAMHANTASAYLSVARYLMCDKEINEIVDNFNDFKNIVEYEKINSLKNLNKY